MKTMLTTWILALVVIGVAQITFHADTTYAYCPEGNDCSNLLVKYEKHSQEWWTEYCNTLGC